MNNMFEYLSGGQCYTCGGKVRYALGGDAPEEEQNPNPIADMSQQGQQIKQPSTLDANAKQLMKFLLEQLSKGTSERILKKTLVDSGVKSEQATQLLEVAKEEFTKITEQGDYVNEMAQQQALQEQQAAALQNQMGMFNAKDPMGMNPQAGPQAGEDPSQMAMQQGADQSQMGDQEMEAQGRYGGSMKRLRRYGAGGLGCPDGFNWDEMTAQCMPSSVTANTMAQGSGAMQFGAPQPQPNAKAGIDAYNSNVVARAQASDARANAEGNFYGNRIANYDANRTAQKEQFNTAIGGLYGAVRTDQSANPQNNIFQSWKNINNPPPIAPAPVVNTGRFGGLARFVDGGMKQYGAGGTEDGCPIGYYKGPDGDCLKIFGSDQSKQEYQKQVVDFYNSGSGPAAGNNRAAMQSYDEFNSQNPAQDQMNTEMKTSPAAYQNYVNTNAASNAGVSGAAPQLTYEQWKSGATPTPTGNATMPTDPRLGNNPYIVQTDKNKIANIDSNWATRSMAIGNSFADPRFAPIAGGFGPGLKFLMGAAAVAGGAGLGIAKGMAGDESRVYDDKGNVFFYNSKGDERRALRNGSQNPSQPTNTNPVTTAPVTGSNAQPTQEQIQQYQNSQLRLPGQAPITPVTAPAAPVSTAPPADNSPSYNPFPPQENPTDFTPGTDKVAPSQSGPLQSDDPNAPNYNPNVPKTVKEEGGEWNPFVDNRRKLNITIPTYAPGGAVDTETAPYPQQEWATKTSRQFPLNRADWDAYNTYTANFNNPANASTPTNGVPNTTDNTNNALSANPSATAVDTKEYTTQQGDPLGFQVASNTLQGFNYMNDAVAQRNEQKSVQQFKKKQQQAGNSMAMGPINTQGSYGTWNLNAGPGANQYVADLGHTQDWGTQLARFGGTKSYRRGGTYEISPEELKRIIEMGGEVEFLD